jgi:serine/threonine protein kinase
VLEVGQEFAGFELLARVDHGQRDAVYKARDRNLQRMVALRLIPREISEDSVTRARLNREANALAAVDHPNVPPIFDAGEHDGQLYISSRWVEGVSIHETVGLQGPYEPRRAVRIVNQVAAALHTAHGLGIMHRDVTPSSVLVTSDDHAYLTGFAFARRASDLAGLTAHDELLAKLDYLAPEYVAGAEPDERVDIYGLGCILYELLTGQVPFDRPGGAAKQYAHAAAEPPAPSAVQADVPEQLDEVVRRAMAKDPDERPQSAAEFAVAASSAVELTSPPWTGEPVPSRAAGDGLADDLPGSSAPAGQVRAGDAPANEGAPGAILEDRPEPARDDELVTASAATLASDRGPGPDASDTSERGDFNEPVYFVNRGGGALHASRRLGLWTLGIVIFVGAAVALLIALLTH